MTDQNQSQPTQGRRRRHKSPASLPAAQQMPLPRLLGHMDAADGPSDEEEEKDAKRQRSAPTTPTPVDHQMNMMRLWESLKWNHGTRKGLKRE